MSAVASTDSRLGRARAWYDATPYAASIVLGWLITRVLSLLLLATKAERFLAADGYYYRKVRALSMSAWTRP